MASATLIAGDFVSSTASISCDDFRAASLRSRRFGWEKEFCPLAGDALTLVFLGWLGAPWSHLAMGKNIKSNTII
jgi:hypothetical protein